MSTILWINPQDHYTKFPDGHVHMSSFFGKQYDTVAICLKSFDDLFWLAQLKRNYPKQFPHLIITYLLAARCDRKFSPEEYIDLKIVAEFINDLKFESVKIVKPHSSVSLALLDNSEEFDPTGYLLQMWADKFNISNLGFGDKLDAVANTPFSIIAPDAGASKWIEKTLPTQEWLPKIIQCNKTRTPNGIEVEFSKTPQKHCVIVDDLCDAGGTFIALAKALREKGAEKVDLIVSHAIFSKGLSNLLSNGINAIYTTNSYSFNITNLTIPGQEWHGRLAVLDLKTIIE